MSTAQNHPPTRTSVAAGLSLAFGLLALALCSLPALGLAAFPLGFLALVAGLWGLHSIRRFSMAGLGLVIGGLVTGGLGLLVAFTSFLTFAEGFRSPAWERDRNQVEQFLEGDSG